MDENLAKSFKEKVIKIREEAKKKGVDLNEVRKVFGSPHVGQRKENIRTNTDKADSITEEGSDIKKRKSQKLHALLSCLLTRNAFIAVFITGIVCGISYKLAFGEERCVLASNEFSIEMTRPMADCGLCRNLYSVPIEHQISPDDFRRKYAYTSIPVLVKDVSSHWTAMSNFSFEFFKNLYQNTDGALNSVDTECQFFPYKTEFYTLSEVFNMSDARARFEEGEKPWYIGWSNCHKEVREELRKHYERPYFLPSDSESSSLDWIFMGGSGPGALVHIDYVQKPSWQAQISGKKTWTLIPPPECENECQPLNVTVHKGDIFVVDTNLWYHSTFIHPGEISITIGSEYD